MEAKQDAAQIEGRFLFGLEASLLKECAAERARPLISISQEENPLSARSRSRGNSKNGKMCLLAFHDARIFAR